MSENRYHVHIYINDVEYSEYVISYVSEAKICTGIGQLTIVFSPELPHEIIPWDNIVIEENGNIREGSYYVTSISKRQPGGEWEVQAQDASKRLTDHFISEVFYIDYPSASLPWLEYFLEDAGVDYIINTTGAGQYLSNNTQLGLQSNYDQVITLLQMNGWYMYFDANDKCRIGPLELDYSKNSDTFNDDDIIDIAVLDNDLMLRNRVVVMGSTDPTTGNFINAEITRHTKWNYDAKDLRTAVISNSNIATEDDAAGLAEQAINEFCQLTTEKRITVKESRGLHIGQTVRVKNELFRGKGLVTSYGVSMDKNGLVSNVILDERCPRLFGFFKPTDLVYVGTYGDGVYGKYLKDDPNWYSLSYGIDDKRITDLHTNKGVFSTVTASGDAYYADNDPVIIPGTIAYSGIILEGIIWRPLNLDNIHPLTSGVEDSSVSYTNLKARGTILDRNYNIIKIAADTRPVENLGDYLMSTDYGNLPIALSGLIFNPSDPAMSGYVPYSGEFESVIIEYSPVGGFKDAYAVKLSAAQVSGIWGVTITDEIVASGLKKGIGIYDIENDTVNDYISVGLSLSGLIAPYHRDKGYKNNLPGFSNSLAAFYSQSYTQAAGAYAPGFETFNSYDTDFTNPNEIYETRYSGQLDAIFNNQPEGKRDLFQHFVGISHANYHITRIEKSLDDTLSKVEFRSPTIGEERFTMAVIEPSSGIYNIYSYHNVDASGVYSITKDVWDSTKNTIETTELLTVDSVNLANNGFQYCTNGDIIGMALDYSIQNAGDHSLDTIDIWMTKIDMRSDVVTGPTQLFFTNGGTNLSISTQAYTNMIFPWGNTFQILIPWRKQNKDAFGVMQDLEIRDIWYVDGEYNGEFQIYYTDVNNYGSIAMSSASLNDNTALHCISIRHGDERWMLRTTGENTNVRVGEKEAELPEDTIPYFYEDTAYIYGIYGRYDNKYIARSGNDFYSISDQSITEIELLENPPSYILKTPLSTRDSVTNEILWGAQNTTSSGYYIVTSQISSSASVNNYAYFQDPIGIGARMYNAGNFFIIPASGKAYFYDGLIPTSGNGSVYFLLERDGEDFNILKSGLFPFRLDISKNNPLVTMQRVIESTDVFDIEMSGVVAETMNPTMIGGTVSGWMFGTGTLISDYRYAEFHSAEGSDLRVVATYSGGIGVTDVSTLATFTTWAAPPVMGTDVRIETTNAPTPDQYMFVAISGWQNSYQQFAGTIVSGEWGFHQKDPGTLVFTDYSSGYPSARTTIIRINDVI